MVDLGPNVQPDGVPGHPTPGMHLWGWMSPTELDWLGAQAEQMESVVEIGCLHGRSSYMLATRCPGRVYCIDPWSDEGWASWNASVGSVFSNVTAIRDYSPRAGRDVPDPVDMVFIDGAHDYDSVVADITYWRTRVRRLLCGHDYVPGGAFPDVAVAVDELLDSVTVAPETAIWTWSPDGNLPGPPM